jgi:pimeloyl-ACP methyl ester carboxylesterase
MAASHLDRLELDGRRIEARFIGLPTHGAPALVFLHEGLGSVALWKDFPDRLATAVGLPALVYSRFGYGWSDPAPLPRPVTFLDDEASVLARVLDAAGIDDAVLVGHSDGASIALVYAATVATAAIGGASGVSASTLRAVIAEAPHVMVEEVTLASIRVAGEAFRDGVLRRRLHRYHADVEAAFRGFRDVWLDPAFARWRIDDAKLAAIRAPLLVIQGEDDPYGTLRQVEILRERAGGPVETLILPAPCGHAPHVGRAGEVLAAMAAFVRAVLAVEAPAR